MTRQLAGSILALVLVKPGAAAPTNQPSIQGVWRAVEVTATGPGPQTLTALQPNLTILTARHYSRVNVESDRPRPALTDASTATADELRRAWGPFAGEAGTYEINDGIILMQATVAKNPAAMAPGAFTALAYRLDGDTLWVTYRRNQNGPIEDPVTVALVRIRE
jgi:hypothetical protein